MTIDDNLVKQLSREYGPMLDALRSAIDTEMNHLRWTPRTDPEELTRRDGKRVLRIGVVEGRGVPLPDLDLHHLTKTVNQVITRFGYLPQPVMTGSPSGYLIMNATDGDGVEFTLMIKSQVVAWVDKPLKDPR